MKTVLTFATADNQPVSSTGVGAALHSMLECSFLNGRVASEAEKAAFLPVSDSVHYDDLVVGDVVFMYNEDEDLAMVGFVANSKDVAEPGDGVDTPAVFYKMVEGDDGEPDLHQHADTKVFVVAQCPERGRR